MSERDAARLRARVAGVFGRVRTALTANSSSRRGAMIQASVVHTTESADGTLRAIVSFFRSAGSQASASYVVGDREIGETGFTEVVRMVPEPLKPWTQLSANPIAVSYELIGRARRSREEWLTRYRAQVRTAAALCAEDALEYGLPVRHGLPGQLGHVDLPRYGYPQSHTDPGPGFPWDVFEKDVAKFYAMGRGRGVPAAETVKVPRSKRPASAPRRVPKWAWSLREWHLHGQVGPRPVAPARVPSWYWDWRKWVDGVGGGH